MPAPAMSIAALAKEKPAFLANLGNIVSGQLACAAVALVTEISYARLLGPEARGVISLCLMSIAFGTLLAGLGGEGTIIFWGSRTHRKHSVWIPAVLLWGLVGLAVASMLWVASYWRVHFVFLRGISPYAALLVLANVPAALLFSYAMAFLTAAEDFRTRSLAAFARQTVVLLGCIAAVALIGKRAEAALWGTLLAALTAGAVALFAVRQNLERPFDLPAASANFWPTLAYGLRGHIGNLATFFTYRLDVFIVNYFLEPRQLGFYALGVAVSESLWQIPQAVASALFPRTARTQQTDGREAARFTCDVIRQLFLTTVICGAVLAAISPVAIPLIFGSAFSPSVAVIFWILPGTVALSLGKVACADLAGQGKNGYSSIFALLGFAITIGLDCVLIPRIGILGAALASSLAYGTQSVLALAALRYELKTEWSQLLVPKARDVLAFGSALKHALRILHSMFSRKTELLRNSSR